jgi:hypothetical protein
MTIDRLGVAAALVTAGLGVEAADGRWLGGGAADGASLPHAARSTSAAQPSRQRTVVVIGTPSGGEVSPSLLAGVSRSPEPPVLTRREHVLTRWDLRPGGVTVDRLPG